MVGKACPESRGVAIDIGVAFGLKDIKGPLDVVVGVRVAVARGTPGGGGGGT